MNSRFPWISKDYRERLLNMAMKLPFDDVVVHYSGESSGTYDRDGLVERFVAVPGVNLVYDHHIDVLFYHSPSQGMIRYLDHDDYVSVTVHKYGKDTDTASLDALLKKDLQISD